MLLFKEKLEYADPLNVIFLCGSNYKPENKKDKRVILKNFLQEKETNCQVVILEENFVFAQNRKGYLAYDNIFVTNLAEVEKLAAIYADKIIIIHETISTAAEIGMFASNGSLKNKICVLVPDDISIEEDKMSVFIKLAFSNYKDDKAERLKKLTFYPDIKVHRTSMYKSEYHTFFHDNIIGNVLGNDILNFVKRTNSNKTINIMRMQYNQPYKDPGIISYTINDNTIDAYVHFETLKIQLLSMFSVEKFRSEFRKERYIKDHIHYITKKYEEILLNSICYFKGIDNKLFSIKTYLLGIDECDLTQATGYFLYMLQATNLIGLEQSLQDDNNIRKIRIKESLEICIKNITGYIYDKNETVFGGMIS